MTNKQKIVLLLVGLSLVLICGGLSFAFFSTLTNNENASTIFAKGGTMKIVYANGSGNITMENIYPKEEAWVNKIFTVTGNNSTELNMEYRLYLVTTSNSFNAGDLTYSISGTSTNQADKLVEKANKPLAKAGEVLMGTGIFKSKNSTHSYNLRIFYKETNEDQNSGQGKSFTGYVSINNGSNLAYDSLIAPKNLDNDARWGNDSSKPAFNGPITKEQVKSITFTNSANVPANAVYSWDAGEKQDGTIMAYLLNKDENGLYDLYIGHDGKILLGSNSSGLFSGYKNVTTMDISNIDTSYVTNMAYMFAGNKASSITGLNKFNTSKVTDMTGMFEFCSNVISLDLSSFDTSNVTVMGNGYAYSGMFQGCTSLTTLDTSSFNTSKVTLMGNVFKDCDKLTTLDLSNFNTSKVTDMTALFSGCKSLTNLDVSNFNTQNVTTMSLMFYNLTSVSSIKGLTSLNTSKVTNMSNMFQRCSAPSLDLSSFDTSNVTTMYAMFEGSKATSLDLSSFNTDKVTDMRFMFRGSPATTGYARTQADANKFNSSSDKPTGLTFTVK